MNLRRWLVRSESVFLIRRRAVLVMCAEPGTSTGSSQVPALLAPPVVPAADAAAAPKPVGPTPLPPATTADVAAAAVKPRGRIGLQDLVCYLRTSPKYRRSRHLVRAVRR